MNLTEFISSTKELLASSDSAIIGHILLIAMFIVSIIMSIVSILKLKKLNIPESTNQLDVDGRNIYDPNTETGKKYLTQDYIASELIGAVAGILFAIGFFIFNIQYSYLYKLEPSADFTE